MEYSDLVRKRADDLVLRFSRHLVDVSLFCPKGTEYANTKDKGTFDFNLSDLTNKERSQVLSLGMETINFAYILKVKKSRPDIVEYEHTICGFILRVSNIAVFLSFLCVAFPIVSLLIVFIKWWL